MNDTLDPHMLLWEALPELTLNIAQTAALCRVSVRQLGYWTRQGYVTTEGRGARRCYGLDAIQRVLTIRRAMDAGASLRQALRQVGDAGAPPVPRHSEEPAPPAAPASLAADQSEALTHRLGLLFKTNPQVRDHAAGLSVKLGRAEDAVRVVAERLCETGVLTKNVSQGAAVFCASDMEAVYA